VAIKEKRTYCVEVKTQYASQKTRPEDELTRDKIFKLKCLADLYAKYHPNAPQKLTIAAVCVTLISKNEWKVKFYENLLE
jgi:Holliday junction resolvase-like predicted endonuclease